MRLDKLTQLRQKIEVAEDRYRQEISIEKELFKSRMSGTSGLTASENYNRWVEQHKRVMEALNEYQDAVNLYLATSKEHLRGE